MYNIFSFNTIDGEVSLNLSDIKGIKETDTGSIIMNNTLDIFSIEKYPVLRDRLIKSITEKQILNKNNIYMKFKDTMKITKESHDLQN